MKFVSTRGQTEPVDLRSALFAGPAPDGGLFMPDHLPELDARTLASFRGMSFSEISIVLANHLLGPELPGSTIESIVTRSLDFDIPLVNIEPGAWALELFHGPTMAFKDVGARFMAGLMSHYHDASGPELTILVATSGDTGSAIAHAFLGLPGIRVVVLFPHGRVSTRQQKQFTTLGQNVASIAVDGTFDDCQALVRQAFADESLREERPLVSANSINIGRLLPQMFYYFYAVAQLPERSGKIVMATPSGNFGNLTAGLMARRMGLPVSRFVAATNVNDVVPEYLKRGQFEARPSRTTVSNAMDVGHPSNFERMMHLYEDDHGRISTDVVGSSWSDESTKSAIQRVYERSGHILDPHSAVGYLGLCDATKSESNIEGVFLATAHPAKFPDVVESQIGKPLTVPDRLARCLDEPEHFTTMNADYLRLRTILNA